MWLLLLRWRKRYRKPPVSASLCYLVCIDYALPAANVILYAITINENVDANGNSINSSVPEYLRLIVPFTYRSPDIRANVGFYGHGLKPNLDESPVERFYRHDRISLVKIGVTFFNF